MVLPLAASFAKSGPAMWASSPPTSEPSSPMMRPFYPVFSAQVSAFGLRGDKLPAGDYWLVAWAATDLAFGDAQQGEPLGSPQSLLANARSNDDWHVKAEDSLREGGEGQQAEKGRREVQGSRFWPSEPILVTVDTQGELTVVASTISCAWWARSNVEMTILERTSNSSSSPSSSSFSSSTSTPSSSSPSTKSDNTLDASDASLPVETPNQYTSPGESIDSVMQGMVNRGENKRFSKKRLFLLLVLVLLFLLAITAWRRFHKPASSITRAAPNGVRINV